VKNIRLRPPTGANYFIVGDNTPPSFNSQLVIYPNYVGYGQPFNITITTSDPSGINEIIIGWWVSNVPSVFNTEYHYIDSYIKNGNQYIFTIPGQKYYEPYSIPPNDLYFRIYNITDGSGNTLSPLYQKEIEVIDQIAPVVSTPVEVSPYQNEYGSHFIEISVNVTEPELASGVNSLELRYYNTSIGFLNTQYIYTYTKIGNEYTFLIPNQSPMENVSYSIYAEDSNYDEPNRITTSWYTFSVGLTVERSIGDTSYANLKDLTGQDLLNISIDASRASLIEIIPYSGIGQPINPEYLILSGRYQIVTNISAIYINNITIIMYYSQTLIDSNDRNESTIVIGIHNGTGYEEKTQDTYVNTIDNYVVLTKLDRLSYFVILGKESGPFFVSNLKTEVLLGTRSINVSWDQNNETDLLEYQIYRSLTPNFNPNISYYIGSTT
jgi:hypothetical protein